jgi:endonuclease YncB( thermonuclease family)
LQFDSIYLTVTVAMYEYAASLVRIVDGDTLHMLLQLGFHVSIELDIRLVRCNAPELATLDGIKARAFVVETLSQATAFKVASQRWDRYGRWLGDIYFTTAQQPAVWQDLSDLLLSSGNAVAWQPHKARAARGVKLNG